MLKRRMLALVLSLNMIISAVSVNVCADELNIDVEQADIVESDLQNEKAYGEYNETKQDTDRTIEFAEVEEEKIEVVSVVEEKSAGAFTDEVEGEYVDSGSCGSGTVWTLFDNDGYYILVLEGKGAVTSTPWKDKYYTKINEIIFSDEITDISNSAFMRYSALQKVHFSANIKKINYNLFYECSELRTIENIGGVECIDKAAFLKCSKLSGVTLPEGLVGINRQAFYQCSSLREITIPNTTKYIDRLAFSGCTSLHMITTPVSCDYYCLWYWTGNDGDYRYRDFAFDNCPLDTVIITKGLGTPINYNSGGEKISNVEVLSGVVWEAQYGGYNKATPWAKSAKNFKVIISEDVKAIGNQMFSNSLCSEVIVNKGVNIIGASAFSGCSKLNRLELSEDITEIGSNAFENATSLDFIEFVPKAKATIGASAFKNCTSLSKVVLGENVYSVEKSAFENDSKIKYIEMPIATVMNTKSFYNVANIEEVKLINNKYTPTNYTISTYSVTPWYESRNSILRLTLEEGILSIGDYTFYGNSKLSSFEVPNSVGFIGQYAFKYCSSLESVTLPVSAIIEKGAFENTGKITNINITKGTGTGVDYNSTSYKYTPWYVNRSKNPTITISPEITKLGDYTFCDSSLTNSLEFNDISVGAHCFENSSVNGIKYGKLNSLGENAFNGCTSLTDFSRKAGASDADGEITAVEASTFKDCSNLASLSLPSSVKEIKENAFSGCSILSTNLITDKVESVGNNAFENCVGISDSITFAKTKTIGDSAFSGCSSIPSVNITSETTNIGQNAFKDCSSLGSIYIKNKTVSLDEEADSNSLGVPGTTKVYGYTNSTAKVYADAHSYEFIPYYCTLAFDANGIEKDIADREITSGDKYGELPVLEREGYTFTGWYKEKTAVTKVASTDDVDVSDDLPIYAGWTPNDYTVTFDANVDGTCDTANKIVTYDAKYGTLPDAVATKLGYHFDGWYTESTGGDKVTSDTIYKIADDSILYAHYVGNTYKITFDANTGACDVESQDVVFDSAYGTLPTAAKTGYSLDGWYTSATDGTKVNSSDIYNTIGNTTLYARYTANQYKVTLDADGGECDKTELDVIFDSAYGDIPAASKAGYTFKEWYTAKANGTKVNSTDIYTIADNSTIYAVYEANTYRVTFDSNGGECDTKEKTYTFGVKYNSMPTTVSKKEGYGFDGWYTAVDGGTKVTADSIYDTADDITLYAHYIANEYDIALDIDGGECDKNRLTVTFDSKYGTLPNATKTGYTFTGWYTDSVAGEKVNADDIYNTLSVKTLYARYEAISYKITLDADGGTVSPSYVYIKYDNKYGTLPEPKKSGYRFDGWTREYVKNKSEIMMSSGSYGYTYDSINNYWKSNNKGVKSSKAVTTWSINLSKGETLDINYKVSSESGYDKLSIYVDDVVKVNGISGGQSWNVLSLQLSSGSHTVRAEYSKDSSGDSYDDRAYVSFCVMNNKKISSDDVMNIAENHTLKAEYSLATTYTLRFDSRDGSCSKSSMTVTYDSSYGTLPVATKTGYTFDGWYTEISGGTRIYSTDKCKMTRDGTVYAKYTPNSYKVTFVADPGAATESFRYVVYDSRYGTLPIAVRTGYEFYGWRLGSYNGSLVNENTICKTAGNIMLYADYTAKTYRITYDANGGECEVKTEDIDFDDYYGELPIANKVGYSFDGWYLDNGDGTRTKVTEDDIFNKDKNIVLYAQYTPNNYIITLDTKGGQCDVKSITLKYLESYGELPVPTKTNYAFDGWYSNDGYGVEITSESKLSEPSDRTIYAKWIPLIRTKGKLSIADMVNARGKMKYVSSDKSKAAVNGKGIVTGKKIGGRVTITGYTKIGSQLERTGEVEILVDAPVVTKKLPVMNAGSKFDLSKEITGTISKPDKYVSLKPSVATVDENGVVTAVGKGSTKICIYYGTTVIKTTVKVL